MFRFSPNKCDYNRTLFLCNEWIHEYESSHECGGQNLINTLNDITSKVPAFCIKDTRPFGNLLSRIEGDDLLVVMKVLMAHINNPNFTLRSGFYEGKTLLQGSIMTGNKELIRLMLANTHGSKTHLVKEPIIIDHESWRWLEKQSLPRTSTC